MKHFCQIWLLLFFSLSASAQFLQTDARLSFEFIENKGQWDAGILFRSQFGKNEIQIGSGRITYYSLDIPEHVHTHRQGESKIPESIRGKALTISYIGGNASAKTSSTPLPHYYNFFQGNDPNFWKSGVQASTSIQVISLYTGVTQHISQEKGLLKSEWLLEPFAQSEQIQWRIDGAESVSIEYGEVFVKSALGNFKETRPHAFQFVNGKKHQVECAYQLYGDTLRFKLGEYNPALPLVIDPEIVFLTYSGSTVDNFGFTACPGENGTMYTGGIATGPYSVNPTGKYPVTAGSFQLTYAGGGVSEAEDASFACDITLSKYSTDGKQLLWATYMGGSNNEDPHSLVVDKQGHLVLFGNTYSKNFPVTLTAYDTSYNGKHDMVVAKFSTDGKTLIGSTFMGGSANDGINLNGSTNYFYADGFRGDVITDSVNNILVAAVSQSANFPVSAAAYQKTLKGTQDGVVFKLDSSLKKLLWSTYIGGDGNEGVYRISIAKNGNVYLCGGTSSTNLPGTTGSFQPNFGGGTADGFLAVLNPVGSTLIQATYLGTDQYDQAFSFDFDPDGKVCVVGQSAGNFPVNAGLYNVPASHQFLNLLQPDLKSRIWSTVFGSGRNTVDMTINAFQVDDCGRIYVSGWGGVSSQRGGSSTNGFKVTPDAFQSTTDGSDFYLMLLNKGATTLLYATFVGGNSTLSLGDHVDGGTSRYDKQGVVYQSMCASCPNSNGLTTPLSDMATTTGSFSPLNKSPRCSNAALKFDFKVNDAGIKYTLDTCASVFTFQPLGNNLGSVLWKFPGGDTSTALSPIHRVDPKYYGDSVRLIIQYKTPCADTAFKKIEAPDTSGILEIPNVFTPNGDGLNDEFRIKGLSSNCDEAHVQIYNRWGQLFYSADVPTFRWNGKDDNGIEATSGVYFVILRTKHANSEEKEAHTTLTLMR